MSTDTPSTAPKVEHEVTAWETEQGPGSSTTATESRQVCAITHAPEAAHRVHATARTTDHHRDAAGGVWVSIFSAQCEVLAYEYRTRTGNATLSSTYGPDDEHGFTITAESPELLAHRIGRALGLLEAFEAAQAEADDDTAAMLDALARAAGFPGEE